MKATDKQIKYLIALNTFKGECLIPDAVLRNITKSDASEAINISNRIKNIWKSSMPAAMKRKAVTFYDNDMKRLFAKY